MVPNRSVPAGQAAAPTPAVRPTPRCQDWAEPTTAMSRRRHSGTLTEIGFMVTFERKAGSLPSWAMLVRRSVAPGGLTR
jgi:hypothetical protein